MLKTIECLKQEQKRFDQFSYAEVLTPMQCQKRFQSISDICISLQALGPICSYKNGCCTSDESSPCMSADDENEHYIAKRTPTIREVMSGIIYSKDVTLSVKLQPIREDKFPDVLFQNLSSNCNEKMLTKMFRSKEILPCNFTMKLGYFKGQKCATVSFKDMNEAIFMFSYMNNQTNEQKYQLGKHIQLHWMYNINDDPSYINQDCEVVLRNIPEAWNAESVEEYVATALPGVKVQFVEDPVLIKNQWCTIMSVSNLEDAESVANTLNRQNIDDKYVKAHLHPHNKSTRVNKQQSHFKEYLFDKEANAKLMSMLKGKLNKFSQEGSSKQLPATPTSICNQLETGQLHQQAKQLMSPLFIQHPPYNQNTIPMPPAILLNPLNSLNPMLFQQTQFQSQQNLLFRDPRTIEQQLDTFVDQFGKEDKDSKLNRNEKMRKRLEKLKEIKQQQLKDDSVIDSKDDALPPKLPIVQQQQEIEEGEIRVKAKILPPPIKPKAVVAVAQDKEEEQRRLTLQKEKERDIAKEREREQQRISKQKDMKHKQIKEGKDQIDKRDKNQKRRSRSKPRETDRRHDRHYTKRSRDRVHHGQIASKDKEYKRASLEKKKKSHSKKRRSRSKSKSRNYIYESKAKENQKDRHSQMNHEFRPQKKTKDKDRDRKVNNHNLKSENMNKNSEATKIQEKQTKSMDSVDKHAQTSQQVQKTENHNNNKNKQDTKNKEKHKKSSDSMDRHAFKQNQKKENQNKDQDPSKNQEKLKIKDIPIDTDQPSVKQPIKKWSFSRTNMDSSIKKQNEDKSRSKSKSIDNGNQHRIKYDQKELQKNQKENQRSPQIKSRSRSNQKIANNIDKLNQIEDRSKDLIQELREKRQYKHHIIKFKKNGQEQQRIFTAPSQDQASH